MIIIMYKARVGKIMDPNLYFKLRDHIYSDFRYMNVNDLGAMSFAGGYLPICMKR